jgi:hypothetical protein
MVTMHGLEPYLTFFLIIYDELTMVIYLIEGITLLDGDHAWTRALELYLTFFLIIYDEWTMVIYLREGDEGK